MKLETEIAGIKLKNPVMVASGTFGYGIEPAEIIDLNQLGAIITKTITLKPREGNAPPRIVETASGMLNAIGLQNEGIKDFLANKLPFFAKFETPLIVNIAGESPEDYAELAKILSKEPLVKGLELNISCPNVKSGGLQFGVDPKLTAEVVKAVRKATKLPIITKLTPNVTDITLIAKAAESAGSDAVSLINTLLGMAIDIENRKSKLGTLTGGLSGPAGGLPLRDYPRLRFLQPMVVALAGLQLSQLLPRRFVPGGVVAESAEQPAEVEVVRVAGAAEVEPLDPVEIHLDRGDPV